jgi:hypothetical protein
LIRKDLEETKMKKIPVVLTLLALAMVAGAQQPAAKSSAESEFDRLKQLAGEWQATAVEDGKEMTATLSFRLAAVGSVLMADLAPGTAHEMITMFHRDNEELLATHYCLTGNQPRMRAVAGGDANVISFEFKDATNLPNQSAPHMGGVRFTMIDANHHTEEWSVVANGRTVIRKFDCRRKQ